MIPSPLLVVTDRHGSGRQLVDTVQAVLDGGARWIWFRDKDLEPAARRALALELRALVQSAGGRLTIGGDVALAAEIGAEGVHLGAGQSDLMPGSSRGEVETIQGQIADVTCMPLDGFAELTATKAAPKTRARKAEALLIGVSAHGLGEVRRAARAGAGYVTLSPIFATASKPGYGPALGLDAMHEAAAGSLPVIALGGITSERAAACRQAGAAGVAVMGAIMRAADPAGETQRYLQALCSST